MKVLYYVEKELAQFDPARRMRGRCEHLFVLCGLCIRQEFEAQGDLGDIKLGRPELSGLEGAARELVAS